MGRIQTEPEESYSVRSKEMGAGRRGGRGAAHFRYLGVHLMVKGGTTTNKINTNSI